ncbi:MAG TPA: lamin tail domain-containing protein [Candidatus Saccharimonadales bacterium]|nr:lamin tail domain-containing protein [Candidatus Saccharimonadales bacterium]
MTKKSIAAKLVTLVSTAVLLVSPTVARADTISPPDAPAPLSTAPILIAEVQTGSSASASEEFIELYNTTAHAIDLGTHNWRLEVASSASTSWTAPLRSIPLSGTIASGQSYVVASKLSSGQLYLPTTASAWFSAGLAATAGHIRLLYTTYAVQPDGTCATQDTTADELEWSSMKNGAPVAASLDGRMLFLAPSSGGLPAGDSLQRLIDPVANIYVDSNSDVADFGLSTTPTPSANNILGAPSSLPPAAWQPVVALPLDTCDPNASQMPPGTGDGSSDSGSTTSDPITPPAGSGQAPPESAPGSGDATDTSSGSGASGSPLPNDDSTAPSLPAADQGLLSPQISELLPNPAAPQTDVSDEFIELYNPNAVAYDLSSFSMTAGLTTVHSYTFPEGTMLEPYAYTAFFSADTHLSLSNTGGQVRLVDPLAAIVGQTDAYSTAKDGQAFIKLNGTWQWTLTPTPNAPNLLTIPGNPAKTTVKTAPAATTKPPKTSVVKAAATNKLPKSAATKVQSTAASVPTTSPTKPIHASILAAVALFAVLYGAYEYRRDMANAIYRFRTNRAARRAARASLKGRGGD